MIYSNINIPYTETGLHPVIIKVLDYLKSQDFLKMDAGVYNIQGDDIYAQVFDATTKDINETKLEFHKVYLDLQYFPAACVENFGVCPAAVHPEVIEAHEEKDLYFTKAQDHETILNLSTGDYVVVWPNDLHRPAIKKDAPLTERKVVVKIKASLLK